MKKLIVLVIVIASFSVQMFSQSISIGLKGGFSFSTFLEESDLGSFSEDYKYIPGFNAGIYFEAEASPDLIGEAGVALATFGYSFESEGALGSVDASLKTNYLLIPLKAKTVKQLGPVEVFASGGVYAGYGLSGTLDVEITLNGVSDGTSEEIVWGNDPDESDMVRMDYGIVGSVGADFKGITLEFGYYFGLANLSPYTEDSYVMSNRAFVFSVGYMYDF